jgi:hypothetical protein
MLKLSRMTFWRLFNPEQPFRKIAAYLKKDFSHLRQTVCSVESGEWKMQFSRKL